MPVVDDAIDATKIAREFMEASGRLLYVINKVVRVGSIWRVEIGFLRAKHVIEIDSKTGKVLKFDSS